MSKFADLLMCRLLMPFSWMYGLGIGLRNYWFDKHSSSLFKAQIPVVAVGNISTGGTGKTPFSEYLLRFFEDQGLRPAYLSRGYGRTSQGYRLVDPQAIHASTYGDEALQVARKFARLPVAVCESRAEGISRLEQEHAPDLIVLDDAFQHRNVLRDVDILLFDAHRLPQRDCLLPAGRLREPKSSIHRANLLVVNKIRNQADIPEIEKQFSHYKKPIAFCRPKFDGIFDFSTDEKSKWEAAHHQIGAVLFSGLGNNEYFRQQVESSGISVLQTFSFPDHHSYSEKDLKEIVGAFQKHMENSSKFDSLLILTTEKDRSRLRGSTLTHLWHQLPLCYIPIRLAFDQGQEALEASLLRLVDSN